MLSAKSSLNIKPNYIYLVIKSNYIYLIIKVNEQSYNKIYIIKLRFLFNFKFLIFIEWNFVLNKFELSYAHAIQISRHKNHQISNL